MKSITPTDICEYKTLDSLDIGTAKIGATGITILPEKSGHSQEFTLKSHTGDFVKWLKLNNPDLAVEYNTAPTLMLRSDNIWLPLVFLASDVSIPIYLQLVYDYLFEKADRFLKKEEPRVSLTIVTKDKVNGKYNKLKFEGDRDSYNKLIENFNLDKFAND